MISPKQVSTQLLAAVLVLATQTAQAQNIKPGLWENQMQPQLSPERQAMMAEAQKQMSAMSAEQRKMIQDMMAKNGINADIGAGVVTLKVCISPEQAALNELPIDSKGKCRHQTQRSGKQIQTQFTCSEPQISGESTATILSPESYSSTTRATTQVNGKGETMSLTGHGRWLGSDCGGIAPMRASKAN